MKLILLHTENLDIWVMLQANEADLPILFGFIHVVHEHVKEYRILLLKIPSKKYTLHPLSIGGGGTTDSVA